MANILDYLDWRGDLTLAERGFNEVDNLLMAELCFLDFSGIVPADFSAPVSLPEAMQKYDAARPQETMGVLVPEQIPELGHKMAASRRFSDLTLCAYVSRTDEETQTQFSALTALLPDKTAYIAFRGTDDTIVGWKEDFNLAFLPVVPAQRMAAEYLAAAAAALPSHPLRVGGHSKGGNLAVYSAVFCGEAVQNQLMRVYNNDGPGFRTSLLGLPEHRRVADKITTILPESSVVGMLLEHEERYEVVRSTQSGLWQHDGFSWQVRGEKFEHLPDLTEGGKLVDTAPADDAAQYAVVTGLTLESPELGRHFTASADCERAGELLGTLLHELRSKDMLTDVSAIHLEDASAVTVRYLDRFDVEFLWDADFDYKLNYLAAVVQELEANEKGTILMTHEGEARFIPG